MRTFFFFFFICPIGLSYIFKFFFLFCFISIISPYGDLFVFFAMYLFLLNNHHHHQHHHHHLQSDGDRWITEKKLITFLKCTHTHSSFSYNHNKHAECVDQLLLKFDISTYCCYSLLLLFSLLSRHIYELYLRF
mgnify:CR=1 FL=1